MGKRIWIIIGLLALVLGLWGCKSARPTDLPLRPTPALSGLVSLPPERSLIQVTRLQHQPGMGAIWGFGQAIAAGDGFLAVGAADWNNAPGKKQGRVYVYRKEGEDWVEESILAADDREDGFQYDGQLGTSVGISGDLVFAGAPYADDPVAGDNTGAVYVFQKKGDEWKQVDRLTAVQPTANECFGRSLAVDGDTLAVIGEWELTNFSIFQNLSGTWQQTQQIELPAEEGYTGRIYMVDLYGDTLAVSAIYSKGEREQSEQVGRVYLFERKGEVWEASQILSDVSGTSLSGNAGKAEHMAVTAGGSYAGFASGSVNIYERAASGWELSETLTAPDSQTWDGFGRSALSGNLLLVGESAVSEDSSWDGQAYLFEYIEGRWVEQMRLTPPEDGGSGDFFGSLVEVYGDVFLVAAPDEFGNAVYVFEVGMP